MCHLSNIYYSYLQEDVCFQGYLRHLSSSSCPAPLTTAEQQLHQIKITEVRKVKNVHTQSHTVSDSLTAWISIKPMYFLIMHLTGQSGTGKCAMIDFVFKYVSIKGNFSQNFVLFYSGREKTSCHHKWTSKGSLSCLNTC